ncbi:MAG: putative bifunctional diguanylate cyclase/phosphodiesterase [Spirochaetia bacterium]
MNKEKTPQPSILYFLLAAIGAGITLFFIPIIKSQSVLGFAFLILLLGYYYSFIIAASSAVLSYIIVLSLLLLWEIPFSNVLLVFYSFLLIAVSAAGSLLRNRNAGQNKKDWELRQLRKDNRVLAKVFESVSDGIVITDNNNIIKMVNPAFTDITGYTPGEAEGKDPSILKSNKHSPGFYESMWKQIRENGKWTGEIWNKKKSSDIYPEHLSIYRLSSKLGTEGYIGVFHDIGKLKQDEVLAEHHAYHDLLTGLPNRLLFVDRLNLALNQADRKHKHISIVLIDLDNFKKINKGLSHSLGDQLLQKVAIRLETCIRSGDTLARMGGDEFVMLLPEIKHPEDAAEIACRILEVFQQPFTIKENEVFITPSMGISVFPEDGTDSREVLRSADLALVRAKQRQKNTYCFYTADMNEIATKRLALETNLRHTISQEGLNVAYQPIVDLKTDKMVSCEALARWTDAEHGIIPPEQFISLAEESGMIYTLGEQILYKSCVQCTAWNQSQQDKVRVSVNLSAKQFLMDNLIDVIHTILSRTGLSPELLTLEITENSIMQNIQHSIVILTKLKSMGLSISIDDFGTGYSSLNYLKKFPIEYLKIDQSFITDLTEGTNDYSIVSAVIGMAHNLDLKVVAEGAEHKTQIKLLKELDCDYVQGFFYSKPVPADSMLPLIHQLNSSSKKVD